MLEVTVPLLLSVDDNDAAAEFMPDKRVVDDESEDNVMVVVRD